LELLKLFFIVGTVFHHRKIMNRGHTSVITLSFRSQRSAPSGRFIKSSVENSVLLIYIIDKGHFYDRLSHLGTSIPFEY
jgi:hypothetical protein